MIKPEDLAEIESFKKESTESADHVSFIVSKVENHSEDKNKREPFKPYKTTKSGVHEPEKEKQRKQNKYWEVTAATPPLIVHDAAKIIDLTESLRLQKEQSEKLQVIKYSCTLTFSPSRYFCGPQSKYGVLLTIHVNIESTRYFYKVYLITIMLFFRKFKQSMQ